VQLKQVAHRGSQSSTCDAAPGCYAKIGNLPHMLAQRAPNMIEHVASRVETDCTDQVDMSCQLRSSQPLRCGLFTESPRGLITST
jgi:hypothetical protein